jgi:hypothetical protein
MLQGHLAMHRHHMMEFRIPFFIPFILIPFFLAQVIRWIEPLLDRQKVEMTVECVT